MIKQWVLFAIFLLFSSSSLFAEVIIYKHGGSESVEIVEELADVVKIKRGGNVIEIPRRRIEKILTAKLPEVDLLNIPTDEETCKEAGGTWKRRMNLKSMGWFCSFPTTDGGKKCADSDECQSGYCKVVGKVSQGDDASGKCTGWIVKDHIGEACWQEVKKGRAGPEHCNKGKKVEKPEKE